MSTAEIISQLSQLSPEDLAEVKAWLHHCGDGEATAVIGVGNLPGIHVISPRLVNPACATDFTKQVTELSAHAKL